MSEPLKILLLEDVPEDAEFVERALRKEKMVFDLQRVDTREGFIDGIRKFSPAVILSDHNLPQFNSVEALKICRRLALQIPFILVTGSVSEDFAVECLRQGADDYLLKGNLSRLPAAINTALKNRTDEKMRQTAEQALRHQNEELIKINKELDHFVYSTSHNLRAPLMSVLGLLNVAGEDLSIKDTSRFPDYFRMMGESVRQLDNTLKEIIDYSKNARVEILREKIDTRKLLEECFAKLAYMEEAEGFEFRVRILQEETIYSDPYRLSVVFTNLISNALKYRDFGKATSFLHVDVISSQGHTDIRLEDNGVGIQSAYLPRIFDMFYRATEKSHGSGLGLYIARETLENIGGTISVESALHVGTVFNIEIPSGRTDGLQFSSASQKLGSLLQKEF